MQDFIRAKICPDPCKRDLNNEFDNNMNDFSFEDDA